MTLFEGANMTLRYDAAGAPAFSDLSLNIRKGDCLFLSGPSGAGKTSLLRVIAGLETPDATRLVRRFERPGFAFAEPRLLPDLTVAQNLSLVRSDGEDIMPALSQLGLRDMADRPAATLSKGQAQRAALLRALGIEPDILLLDEALGGLDAARWEAARDMIRKQHEKTGLAIIEVTHDPARRLFQGQSLSLDKARETQ
ncbi:ATP-binding cassette domain-containing protein [Puniceibacterium sp. IMCC21224]|uniref:ATP-binding cassette domain-containing protein n=1 Tax=Puniceibacterium sp. IMCC21224 TaxID=1618204 RepID=UPI00065D7EF8|nr:ATP-binding cassette domain-containing protein [Puniceibacterium sp. IMCC21224]KMK64666.1 ABC transporter [Puniceibacterium sp. IMCC21224]